MKPSKKQAAIPAKKPSMETVRKVHDSKHKQTGITTSLFDTLENHFEKKQKLYLIIILGLATVLSFLCFDAKISLANDDALYIESGARYAKDFFAKESFYLANAPLYPTLLGVIIKLFGVKLILLKSFSILFFCSGLLFLFMAFRNRIPFLILIPSLLLTAINFPFLMYASLTYSECLYLLMMGFCFYLSFKAFDKIFAEGATVKDKILPSFIIGSTAFLFLITRNIAIVAIVPIVLFLLYRKRFIETGMASAMFVFLYFFYRFMVKIIWHVDQSQYEGQKLIFQKDAYNPQAGMETTSGFIVRLIDNAQIYIGQRFMYVLGFKEEISTQMPTIAGKTAEINSGNKLIVFLFVGIILASMYFMHKNKQYILLFSTLFFSCILGANFIALQTSWGQTRFIMIYLPLILMSVFYLLYHIGKQFSATQYILPFVFFILFISSLKLTLKNASERFPVFMENIKGDPTFGYTTDWQNYIKMTRWCAENLPDKTKEIAVRKAPMSFIFSSGKEFYPIYGTPTDNPDSLLIPLRTSNVNYIMPSELRADPNNYIPNQIIGTIHRYMYYVAQKYPDAFQFVHQEGDIEIAQLYKIDWNYIDSLKATIK
jgi:hypothetical protein